MNLKRLFLCSLAGVAALSTLAVPAKRGIRTFAQPDGTTIPLQLVGDEFFHTYVTLDGLSVSRGEDGMFRYRTTEGLSDVMAHDMERRSSAEKAFISSNAAGLQPSALAKSKGASARRAAARQAAPDGPRRASQVPSSGNPRIPILLVQYADYHFKDADPKATFENFFNGEGKSAFRYFNDQSNDKYSPSFELYGPVTLSGKRAVYGGNDSNGNDVGVGTMVGEACQQLDSSIDFSLYDNDGDGECDVVIVIYAGDGEASSYDPDSENAIWPCQWALSSSDFRKALNLDGTKVNKFAVFNELNGSNLSRIDGIGTFCHEYSHCLDLPDFYDTQYGPHFGMAAWSLLDSGCYNDDGYTPVGYTAYEKEFMGWIDINEAGYNSFYTLPVFNSKNADSDVAVRLTNPADPDEYYIIENRARQGWDAFLPAEGLLITHVTYDANAWFMNCVNDFDVQRMTPIPADNNLKLNTYSYWGQTVYEVDTDNLKGDLWPYNGADKLTDSSIPAAAVNKGGFMGKPVTEMTRNSDGTISFWVLKGVLPPVAAPELKGHIIENNTAVTVMWQAADDAEVSYTLEIMDHSLLPYTLVSETDFSNADHGWSTTGYTGVDESENALKFGSNKQAGSATSPEFNTGATGEVTAFVNAKNYGNDETTVTVDLLDASGKVVDTQTFVPLSSSFDEYRVLLTGTPESPVKLRIRTTALRSRFYLRSISIYTGNAMDLAAAPQRTPNESGDELTRTVTGITGTSYKVTGLKANGIYDYRVKAVPFDTDSFAESAWSRTNTVDLSGNGPNGIDGVESDLDASDAPAEYFNLQGIRMDGNALAPGIYIRRQGNRTSKITVN